MPEYLAPGVFVEETSFRAKSIQGVGTSTTAFVGPTLTGPLGMASDVLTSFGEFERVYGGLGNLSFGATTFPNYVAHAAKAFFDNGGARLYISRAFAPRRIDGRAVRATNSARAAVGSDGSEVGFFRARSPGTGANGVIVAYEKRTPASTATLNSSPPGTLATDGTDFFAKAADGTWPNADASATLDPAAAPEDTQIVTLNLEIRAGATSASDPGSSAPVVLEKLGFGGEHPRALSVALPETPSSRAAQLTNQYWFDETSGTTPFTLQAALFPASNTTAFVVANGVDGGEPIPTDNSFNGVSYEDALGTLEEIPDIAIVAAPGCSALTASGSYQGTQNALISHAERMRYRIAVLDTPPAQGVGDVRAIRGAIDSKYAAMYYPWVVVPNPAARPSDESIPKEIALPPSGFVSGIYARNDVTRGVWKAPANEVVRGALRFEREISKGEQEVLNPEGVNCLRSFFGRGNRVWGARTISSDPEWMYVNIRRYFIYLEHSIDRSTQWAVFEPNGPQLWSNITDTITSFLFAEWRSGALLGATPEEAFFVRCDRSTMTQADIDNGRLICEIGVAAIKPAEFVIFRIGQKTADADI